MKPLNDVNVTVADYIGNGASTSQPGISQPGLVEGGEGGRAEPGVEGYTPRGFRTTEEGGKRYGYTETCPGCVWLQNKLGARRNHTAECRARFGGLMGQDEEGKENVMRAQARQDEWMAKEIEATDTREPNTGAAPGDNMDGDAGSDSGLEEIPVYKSDEVSREEQGSRSREGEDEGNGSAGGGPRDEDEGSGSGMDTYHGPQPEGPSKPTSSPRRMKEGKRKAEGVTDDEPSKAKQQDVRVKSPQKESSVKKERWCEKSRRCAVQCKQREQVDEQGNASDDSSGQGSTDMDDDGNWLAPRADGGSELYLGNPDETDRNIIAAVTRGIDATEVFSPARATQVCNMFKLVPGSAFDLNHD